MLGGSTTTDLADVAHVHVKVADGNHLVARVPADHCPVGAGLVLDLEGARRCTAAERTRALGRLGQHLDKNRVLLREERGLGQLQGVGD